MASLESLQKEINSIKRKNKQLEKKVLHLEEQMGIEEVEESNNTKVVEEKVVKSNDEAFNFESKVVLKWFTWIGILALVLGVGYFIKYAIENDWISPVMRIFAGIAFGLGLVISGNIISKQEKYSFWARSLMGGGFAIIYFAIYSMYHFEEYRAATEISLATDIVMLSLVVICAILVSLKHNSEVIFGEAFFLGYITSLLSNNFETLTLIYCFILTLGLVTIVSYKRWNISGFSGLIASYIVYMIWYLNNSESILTANIFLILFFIVNTIQIMILKTNSKEVDVNYYKVPMTLINSFAFYISYLLQFTSKQNPDMGLFTLYLSIFYVVMYFISKLQKTTKIHIVHLYLAILYFTLFIPLKIDKDLITIFWALEALLLSVLSFKFESLHIRITSFFVATIAFSKTLMFDTFVFTGIGAVRTFSSTRLASYLVTIGVFYLIAWFYNKNIKSLVKDEIVIPQIYTSFATFLVFVLMILEFERFWISIGWMSFALVLQAIGFIFKDRALRIQAICLFAVTILKIFLYDTGELETIYRIISFMILGAILLLISLIYTKYKDKLKDIL